MLSTLNVDIRVKKAMAAMTFASLLSGCSLQNNQQSTKHRRTTFFILRNVLLIINFSSVQHPKHLTMRRQIELSLAPTKLESNPVMDWLQDKYPEYTKGTIRWLMIPVSIRHLIYDYHTQWWKSLPQRTKPPRALPPLAYACRTFRNEFRGMVCSRSAVFKSQAEFIKFTTVIRRQGLNPYV